MKQPQQTRRYPVKVTPDLREWLEARADMHCRTVNGEILAILKDAKGGETKDKQASKRKRLKMSKFNIFATHSDGTKERLHATTFEEAKEIAAATGASSYEIEDGETGKVVSFEEANEA
jgi:hypothetical protein